MNYSIHRGRVYLETKGNGLEIVERTLIQHFEIKHLKKTFSTKKGVFLLKFGEKFSQSFVNLTKVGLK